MSATLNPYLSFRDNAREAMEFYHSIFGGALDINTFADYQAAREPAEESLVMHAQLEAPDLTLMASDTTTRMPFTEDSRITLSLNGDDDATLRTYWGALAEGGTITMPLEKAMWGDEFGMLTDRFGIPWMVSISASAA